MFTKKRNIATKSVKSKSLFKYFLLIFLLPIFFSFISCSNNANDLNKKNDSITESKTKKILVKSIGYGDSKESALEDAKKECAFKAFGTINSDINGKLVLKTNGECTSYTVIKESMDEVGMWSVKIQAEVIEKI